MISDQQWAEIKRTLHRVGVDADTVMVCKRPFRDELDRLAAKYAELANQKVPTTQQMREHLGDIVKKIDALRESLDPADYGGDQLKPLSKKQLEQDATPRSPYALFADQRYEELKDVAEVCDGLDRIKDNLQRQIKANQFPDARDAPEIVQRGQEPVMEWPTIGNARKLQNEYWTALTEIWRELVPACSNKEVVTFVATVTGAKPSAIRSYLYRSARCN